MLALLPRLIKIVNLDQEILSFFSPGMKAFENDFVFIAVSLFGSLSNFDDDDRPINMVNFEALVETNLRTLMHFYNYK
jgi:hypothetical protein